jgi:phosphoadenosine phosphosulfate reductase
MSNVFTETARRLHERALTCPAVVVAFSGGKDSLALLDLCVKAFARVHVVHLYFVPGMSWTRQQLALVRERYGIEPLLYPAPDLVWALKRGVYCDVWRMDDIQDSIGYMDIFALAAQDLGCQIVMTGRKRIDGMRTEAHLKRTEGIIVQPLFDWRTEDVLAYLAVNKIPLPRSDGRRSSSFDMTVPNLLWLYDHARDDFELIAKLLPYIRAVPKRREFYGEAQSA